jgi:hypothetical protein
MGVRTVAVVVAVQSEINWLIIFLGGNRRGACRGCKLWLTPDSFVNCILMHQPIHNNKKLTNRVPYMHVRFCCVSIRFTTRYLRWMRWTTCYLYFRVGFGKIVSFRHT